MKTLKDLSLKYDAETIEEKKLSSDYVKGFMEGQKSLRQLAREVAIEWVQKNNSCKKCGRQLQFLGDMDDPYLYCPVDSAALTDEELKEHTVIELEIGFEFDIHKCKKYLQVEWIKEFFNIIEEDLK